MIAKVAATIVGFAGSTASSEAFLKALALLVEAWKKRERPVGPVLRAMPLFVITVGFLALVSYLFVRWSAYVHRAVAWSQTHEVVVVLVAIVIATGLFLLRRHVRPAYATIEFGVGMALVIKGVDSGWDTVPTAGALMSGIYVMIRSFQNFEEYYVAAMKNLKSSTAAQPSASEKA